MKTVLLSFGVFVSTIVICSSALADAAKGVGLFVEPALTYQRGDSNVTYPAPLSGTSGKSEGMGLAGRLGFHLSEVVFAGVDARYAWLKFKDSSGYESGDGRAFNYGPVVGIQTPPFGLRVWAGYVLDGENDPGANANLDVKFSGAGGYRIGAGVLVAILSVNLEYQDLSYRKTTLQQLGPFVSGSDFGGVKFREKTWTLSVSFPVEI